MTRTTYPSNTFPNALKSLRVTKQLSQEDFSLVSSRTYVSALERGIYSPTLSKVDALAEVLDVHPLTLLALSYMKTPDARSARAIFDQVLNDLRVLETP